MRTSGWSGPGTLPDVDGVFELSVGGGVVAEGGEYLAEGIALGADVGVAGAERGHAESDGVLKLGAGGRVVAEGVKYWPSLLRKTSMSNTVQVSNRLPRSGTPWKNWPPGKSMTLASMISRYWSGVRLCSL